MHLFFGHLFSTACVDSSNSADFLRLLIACHDTALVEPLMTSTWLLDEVWVSVLKQEYSLGMYIHFRSEKIC